MSPPVDALPPHDPRDPVVLRIAHTALVSDEAIWRRAAFVGLRFQEGQLLEVRQCPQCPSVVFRPIGFVDAARALAGRLTSLEVPLSLSLAAQALADWASQTATPPLATKPPNEAVPPSPTDGPQVLRIAIGTSLKEAERRLILAALESCEGSRSETAQALGLSRRTLYNKLASIRRRQNTAVAASLSLNGTTPSPGKPRHMSCTTPQQRAAPRLHSELIASHSK